MNKDVQHINTDCFLCKPNRIYVACIIQALTIHIYEPRETTTA